MHNSEQTSLTFHI